MTWDKILVQDDLIGGDFEWHESDMVYRGPVRSLQHNGPVIEIQTEWTALLTGIRHGPTSVWEKCESVPVALNPEYCPILERSDGGVVFLVPSLGTGVLFPKGGSKLDPERVRGLRSKKVQV